VVVVDDVDVVVVALELVVVVLVEAVVTVVAGGDEVDAVIVDDVGVTEAVVAVDTRLPATVSAPLPSPSDATSPIAPSSTSTPPSPINACDST
jgi:hypothetical protein